MHSAVMIGYNLAAVVVEAAYRSGAPTPARLVLEHGRRFFLMRSLIPPSLGGGWYWSGLC
ncbi:hypothetical protein ABZ330_20380 [Streptomyces sp. NPDC006172]|uniref:hypothetical protein n=1 Tax=Streptomyces sp. NPDC006172 TaxID=3154470 RepID=UPI00340B9926